MTKSNWSILAVLVVVGLIVIQLVAVAPSLIVHMAERKAVKVCRQAVEEAAHEAADATIGQPRGDRLDTIVEAMKATVEKSGNRWKFNPPPQLTLRKEWVNKYTISYSYKTRSGVGYVLIKGDPYSLAETLVGKNDKYAHLPEIRVTEISVTTF